MRILLELPQKCVSTIRGSDKVQLIDEQRRLMIEISHNDSANADT